MTRKTLPLSALLALCTVELAVFRVSLPLAKAFESGLSDTRKTILAGYEHFGLFLHFSVSILAAILLAVFLSRVHLEKQVGNRWLRRIVVLSCGIFAGLSMVCIALANGYQYQFLLEVTFTTGILSIAIWGVFSRGTGILHRVGIVVVSIPLLLHFYGPFLVFGLNRPEYIWQGLPESLQWWGTWSIIFAAVTLPFLLGPRPFLGATLRSGPILVASVFSVIAHLSILINYDGTVLAVLESMGVDIGPSMPPSIRIGSLAALFAGLWTFIACTTSTSMGYRKLGIGLGLVFVGGYGFKWPLQYIVQVFGMVVFVDAVWDIKLEPASADVGEALDETSKEPL